MKFFRGLGAVLVVALPLALLFDPRTNFYYDWHNHQWFTGYVGEYLRQHLAMPGVFNAAQAVGMPQPMFYGYLLFPALGTLASLLGASLALRVAAVAVLALQFFAVGLAARRLSRHGAFSVAVALAITWATYPLTNLYNRAALPEFYAVALLNSALGFGAAAFGAESTASRRRAIVMAGALMAAAAGCHPPTALMGGGFLLLLLIVAGATVAPGRDVRGTALVVVATAIVGLAVLAPWLYATVSLRAELGVVGKYRDMSFFPDRSDSWIARFAPFPYDRLSAANGGVGVSTPYAEAPINFALLVLVAWNLALLAIDRKATAEVARRERAARWFAGLGLAWFAVATIVSLSPMAAGLVRGLAPYIQFASRLVSHANAGLLVAALATGAMLAQREAFGRFRRGTGATVAVGLVIAMIGVLVKLAHGAVVMDRNEEPQYAWAGDRSALVTAGRADAAYDYATVRFMPQLLPAIVRAAPSVSFPVGDHGADFGMVRPVRVEVATSGWVVTNVVAFKWNHVWVDGREWPAGLQAAADFRLALKLPAGSHALEWRWQPDPLWVGLGWLARFTLIGLLAAGVGAGWRAIRRGSAATTANAGK